MKNTTIPTLAALIPNINTMIAEARDADGSERMAKCGEAGKLLDQVDAAADALRWLVDEVSADLPVNEDSVRMAGQLVIVRGYLIDYMAHRVQGLDHVAALDATAKATLRPWPAPPRPTRNCSGRCRRARRWVATPSCAPPPPTALCACSWSVSAWCGK
jgi:hypothetical protein